MLVLALDGQLSRRVKGARDPFFLRRKDGVLRLGEGEAMAQEIFAQLVCEAKIDGCDKTSRGRHETILSRFPKKDKIRLLKTFQI